MQNMLLITHYVQRIINRFAIEGCFLAIVLKSKI